MVLFGKKIKQLRQENNFSQTELAKLLGVTKSTVGAYENDSRQPSYDVLVKMSRVFNVSIDTILLNQTSMLLDVSHLNTKQRDILQNLIESFEKSNLIDDAISLKTTSIIDTIIKYREIAEIESNKSISELKKILDI